jgi:putative transposase
MENMAHPGKQNSKLLEIYQGSSEEGSDPIKGILRHTIQQMLEEEMTAFLNAEPYCRTDERVGYRNGYKPRVLKTRVGRLELMVPKDREGRFQTELFEKYQRNEKALMLALVEMYVQGVSTRRVRKITEELCGLEISKSQVSLLAKGLDEEIGVWRSRLLEKRYPYLVVDALYEKVRQGGSGVSRGVLTIIGIDEEGYREILGVWCADTENETSWSQVFYELKERGLTGVEYVVSDDHKGLVKAIHRHFQGVIWQRCQVHFIRNVMDIVPKRDRSQVLAILREITTASCMESAQARLRDAVKVLDKTHPRVSELLDSHGEEILAVYALPEHHRKRMHSTNMEERLNKEIRRRTRVVGVFPNEDSVIRLVSAMAIEKNEEWMELKYLNMSNDYKQIVFDYRNDSVQTVTPV